MYIGSICNVISNSVGTPNVVWNVLSVLTVILLITALGQFITPLENAAQYNADVGIINVCLGILAGYTYGNNNARVK